MKVVLTLILILALGVTMLFWGKKKSVIEVKFFEGTNKTPFAVSNMPIDQLPETFEINTTMHLGETEWRVVSAEPAKKGVFRKSGKLNLYLHKDEITEIDPNKILYSLPTISNEIAGIEEPKSLENIVVFREDDWRQFEFLTTSYEHAIGNEFDYINNIYENHRMKYGFKNIHIRRDIIAPLESSHLTLASLQSSFEISKQYDGVAFNNAAATVVGGFALETESGWILWGQKNERGKITVLNLSQTQNSSITSISDKIGDFTEKFDLYLIDWPRLFWCGVGKSDFSIYSE